MKSGNVKRVERRLTEILTAWETHRPAKEFAGMTLGQAKETLQPWFTARQRMVELRTQLAGNRKARVEANRLAVAFIERLVGGVKADPEETGDGQLYQAMGYVPKSARRSGLTRLPKQPEPGAEAVAKAA